MSETPPKERQTKDHHRKLEEIGQPSSVLLECFLTPPEVGTFYFSRKDLQNLINLSEIGFNSMKYHHIMESKRCGFFKC